MIIRKNERDYLIKEETASEWILLSDPNGDTITIHIPKSYVGSMEDLESYIELISRPISAEECKCQFIWAQMKE